MLIMRLKWNMSADSLKNVDLPFFQGIRLNIFSFTLTITEVI